MVIHKQAVIRAISLVVCQSILYFRRSDRSIISRRTTRRVGGDNGRETDSPTYAIYIVAWILLIGVLGSLLWLIIAPPAAYARYQHWFQAAFDLVFGGIFIACGLFYHSWFGTIMGVDKAPVILRFGPNRARMWYIVVGLIFLTLGVIGFLLHSR